ncbi:DUF5067 domain-containing protein [Enterococcus sp. HY326]|uniref:DUF5067 domain-containing protein n=1 Tax=Enterococcus sp. HY326 TaxID=2971265 RepID=UPI002240E2AA|nr:DUF5067 domain-containing protein [Enterococcus sp. HY326]
MKRQIKLLSFCFFTFILVLLSACDAQNLAGEPVEFSALEGSYSIKLPENWEEEKEPTTLFTSDTLFGAQDTKSLSYMMVRGYEEELFTEEGQLEDYGETLYSERYVLENVEQTNFKVGDYFGRHYRLQSQFQRKETWLDVYLVSVENAVIEFQFYSPIDRSASSREKLFTECVQTLVVDTPSQEITNQDTEASVGEAIAEDYKLKMSSYQVMEEDGTNYLVIRYLCTNTSSTTIVPEEKWMEAVTVSQSGQELAATNGVSDSEIMYLLGLGTQVLQGNYSIECAAVYQLDSSTEAVTLDFDKELFINSETTILPIGGN